MDRPRWESSRQVAFVRGQTMGTKVAAFDFDGTLVIPADGRRFIARLWVTLYTSTLPMLHALAREGWTIAIFSNQLLARRPSEERRIRAIFDEFRSYLSFRPYIYYAKARDNDRKPATGMWELFLQHSGIRPTQESFYCGDAEGSSSPFPEYRWSDSDALFAQNIGLPFLRPNFVFPPNFAPLPREQARFVLVIGSSMIHVPPLGGRNVVVYAEGGKRAERDRYKRQALAQGYVFELWWIVRPQDKEDREYSDTFEDPRDDGDILYRL